MNIRHFSFRRYKSDPGHYRVAIVRCNHDRVTVEVTESPTGRSVQVHVNGERVWPR